MLSGSVSRIGAMRNTFIADSADDTVGADFGALNDQDLLGNYFQTPRSVGSNYGTRGGHVNANYRHSSQYQERSKCGLNF